MGDAGSPLERCTGGDGSFLDRTWGKRATVIPAGQPGGFEDLLTLDDVDRALTTSGMRSPYFRLVQAGERIPEESYSRSGRTGSRDVHGMVDPARVASLFEEGATIVLQGMHRWSEPVARFCRDLELQLGHACQVNAYVTPPGAQGLDEHSDPHDVFVLQAFGHKRWQIHAAPAEATRQPIAADVDPGDSIYMPAGTVHSASAQDIVSGHLTVGVHVTSWADVVRGIAFAEIDPIAGALPAGWLGEADDAADQLGERLNAFVDALAKVDAREAIDRRAERFLSNRPQLARGTIMERADQIDIGDETSVRRREGSICKIRSRDGVLVVLLGDRRLEMPLWLEPVMRWIADSDGFRVGDLALQMPELQSRRVLVGRLIREGLLTRSIPASG
jgi:lysine-specific demethylase/histidyl-hydroxylase NO66